MDLGSFGSPEDVERSSTWLVLKFEAESTPRRGNDLRFGKKNLMGID